MPPSPYLEPPLPLDDVPPIAGGTLLLKRDHHIVAADAARDMLYISTPYLDFVRRVELHPADEPGRMVEDANGRVHVALRRAGALVTLDVELGAIVERRPVCPAPRGVGYDPATDELLVACKGGELITLPAAGGAELGRVYVDSDLRDVIVGPASRYVTRFRSAELLTLSPEGAILERRRPIASADDGSQVLVPSVAWRTRALPGGDLLMLHQRAFASPVRAAPASGGYGAPTPSCSRTIVQTTVTRFPASGTAGLQPGPILFDMALAVDLAVDPAAQRFSVSSAATDVGRTATYPMAAARSADLETCLEPESRTLGGLAVVATSFGLLIQQREPARLVRAPPTGEPPGWVWLDPRTAVMDRGHDLFHEVTNADLACASCHPEGGEDGHVWRFDLLEPRRTQTMRGGILATAPFHWSGDQPGLAEVMQATFTERMRGRSLSTEQVAELGRWLDSLPTFPSPPNDEGAIAAGAAIFAEVGCESCHSGAARTNDETLLLTGAAEPLQVPMLRGVVHRAPYLHDGCAGTLEETFDGSCAPGHLPSSPLDPAETSALVAYLRSL